MQIEQIKIGMRVTPESPKNWAFGETLIVTELIPRGEGGIDGRAICGRSVFLPSQLTLLAPGDPVNICKTL